MIGFLLNLAFCSFLAIKFREVGIKQNIYRVNNKHEEIVKTVMETTIGLLNYNFFICIYIMFLLFMFAWLIVGMIWHYNALPCTPATEATILQAAHLFAMICMWIYNIGGVLLVFIAVFFKSFDEGSCMSYETTRFVIQCMTLGIVDIEKCRGNSEERKIKRVIRFRQNKEKYSVERKKWIAKGVHIINLLGMGGQPRLKEQMQQRQRKAIIKAGPNFGVIDIKNFEKVNKEVYISPMALNAIGGITIPMNNERRVIAQRMDQETQTPARENTMMNETQFPLNQTINHTINQTRNTLALDFNAEDVPEDFNRTIEIKKLPILTDPNKEPKGNARLDMPVVRDFYAVSL